MATNGRFNYKIGFSVDKAGLEEMQSIFQRIDNQATQAGDKATAGLKRAGETARKLDAILDKTFNTELGTLNVTKFNQELQKSGLTLKQVKSDLTSAGGQGVVAYNRLAQAVMSTNIQLKQSNKILDQMFTTFKNTVRYGISSSIFNNFTNSIVKAYDYTKNLDKSLNDIRIVTGKSADEMNEFAIKANQAAKQLSASTLDMTEASLIYYQQGLSDQEAQARAETTVKVANVTGQKADEVSEQLTAVWNGYKVSAQETELYIDKLAAVAATTAADLEELSTGMSKVASAAASMGVNFDDLNAQIATIVSVTRQAPESVGTALKTIYARIGDLKVDGVDEFGVKLGEVSSQLEVMGIQVLKENGDMKDMSTIIADVAAKWDTWTQAQKQAAAVAIAGKRQYNNLIALFDNWDMYTSALETSTNALGTLQKQQDVYMESTQAKLTKLRATWQDLYRNIGDTKTINGTISGLTNVVQVFSNFSKSVGGGLGSILTFAGVISNIFSKQIITSINNAIQNTQILKNNIEAIKAQQAVTENGIDQGNNTESLTGYEKAVIGATAEQLELLEKIKMVRAGLTQEQQNQLINAGKEIAQLTEKKVLQEEIAKTRAQQFWTEEQIQKFTSATPIEVEKLLEKYQDIDKIEKERLTIVEEINKKLQINEEFDAKASNKNQRDEYYKNLVDHAKKELGIKKELTEQEEIIRNQIKAILDSETSVNKQGAKLHEFLNSASEEAREFAKNMLRAAEGLSNASGNSFEIEGKINAIKQESNALLEAGARAVTTGSQFTILTSSVSSLTMAWKGMSSIMQTLNNEDLSFGDKMAQIITSLMFTLPIVTNSLKKVNEITSASLALKKKEAIETEIVNGLKKKDLILTETQEGLYTVINIETNERLILTKQQVKELGIQAYVQTGVNLAEKEGTKETTKLTIAQLALNKAMEANPIIKVISLLTTAVAAVSFITSIIKKQKEAQKELNEETIKHADTIQQEIDNNKKLYDSYVNLYEEYKQNKIAKEDLVKTAEEIAEQYGIELTVLEKLTGQYDKYTEAVKNKRKEELEEGIKENKKKKAAAAEELNTSARKGVSRFQTGNSMRVGLQPGFFSSIGFGDWLIGEAEKVDDQAVIDILKEMNMYSSDTYSWSIGSDTESLLNAYDLAVSAKNKIEELDPQLRNSSESYAKLKKFIDDIEPSVKAYRESIDAINENEANLAFGEVNFESISSFDELDDKLDQVRQKLKDLGIDEENQEKLINSYISSTSNEYAKKGLALDQLSKKLKKTKEELKGIKGFDYILSGNIDLNSLMNLSSEQIEKAIEREQNKANSQDLTTVTSLRDKITSSSKLSKSDLEEKLGEENQLAKDYIVELTNFENEAELKQLETLNGIINEKIEIQKRYIQEIKEITQQQLDDVETQLKQFEERKYEYVSGGGRKDLGFDYGVSNYLENDEEFKKLQDNFNKLAHDKQEAGVNWTDNQEEEYEKARKALLDYTNDTKKYLDELIVKKKELEDAIATGSADEVNDSIYDMMITGIDGVISEAKLLKSLISDIGENWVIAADKVQNFAKNFPEILDSQEKYNILTDGSIQLTEEGKKAYEEQVELRKEDLQDQVAAYTFEIQKQIDMKKASADYHRQQAELLRAYLKNRSKGKEIEKQMEQNLANYVGRLQDITGNRDSDLANQIIQNSKATLDAKKQSVTEQYKAYVDLGNIIQAAYATEDTGVFVIPDTLAINKATTYYTGDAKQYDSSKYEGMYSKLLEEDKEKLTDEQLEELIKEEEKLARLDDDAIAELTSRKLAAQGLVKALDYSLNNTGKSKKDKEKKYDDEFDRYYDIKKAIELVSNVLDKLSKIQEKLHGHELISALKNENRLLELQAKNYEKLYEQQKKELDEVKASLSNYGASFDQNGFLTNYATLTASVLEDYKTKIAKAGTDEAKQFYEKQYEDFKKQLDRYNTLYYNEMKDTQDKLDEYRRKIIENNLKSWETEIKVKLDMKQAERDWADFLKEINEDFKKVYKDLSIEMNHLMTKMETYSGMGTIETDLQAISDVMREIDKMNSGQASDMFESISDAQEKLKELDKQLEDDAKNMKSLWEEAWNTYLEGIDQTDSKLDDMMDRFEKISEELEFQGTLIELLYGKEAYGLMDKLYKGQEQAMMNQIEAIKDQTDMWHQLWIESGATMDNQAEWSEDQKKYYEQWMESQSQLNSLTTEYIELLQKDYLNTVDNIFRQLEIAITGSTLDNIATQWDRIKADSDKYYDDIEHAYEVQKFANKIDQDIAKATGKNQQKLQALRDKEITYLREKENLTKYDLDAAEARYQIALKEIALEEAQQNKTSMKLVRNEQGNWAYQYMADADDVAKKQDDLLASYGNLYKLADDAYQDNLESLQSLQETYLQSAKEINSDLTLSEEEREQKLLELRIWYEDQYNKLAEENELYRQDLQTSGAGLLLQVYQQDQTAYEYMTSTEQALLDGLISSSITSYQDLEEKVNQNYNNIREQARISMEEIRQDWTSSAQGIADAWNKDDGQSVKSQVITATNAILEAAQNYKDEIDKLAEAVERDFGEEGIAGAIGETADATDELSDKVQSFCLNSQEYLKNLKTTVEDVGRVFESIVEKVKNAVIWTQKYLAMNGKDINVDAQDYDITDETGGLGDYESEGDGTKKVYEKGPFYIMGPDINGHDHALISTNEGKGFSEESAKRYKQDKKDEKDPVYANQLYLVPKLEEQTFLGLKGNNYGGFTPFNSGGYTGAWGDEGKLALLHQKELVLNADDTSNFLSGISLLRDMVSLNGSIEKSIAAAVGGMALQLGGISAPNISGSSPEVTTTSGDTYYVTADFPNANNAEEIKQAILNLPNIVSQYIGRNKI